MAMMKSEAEKWRGRQERAVEMGDDQFQV